MRKSNRKSSQGDLSTIDEVFWFKDDPNFKEFLNYYSLKKKLRCEKFF